jgi:hypothetical protein
MVKDVVNKVVDALAGAVRKALHVAAGDTTPAAPVAPPSSDLERQMKVAERVMELDRGLLRELAKR